MKNANYSGSARVAIAAGLGVALLFGSAPVVAMAAEKPVNENVPSIQAAAQQEDTVASVNGVEYSSLEAALSAASAEASQGKALDIVLFMDIEGSESAGIEIPSGMVVTLDLNGHDLVGKNSGPWLVNRGTLTINDSVGDGCVYSTNTHEQGRHAVVNYGQLVINGGIFGDKNADATDDNDVQRGNAVRNFGAATINGGKFTACDNYTNGGYAYAIANGDDEHNDAYMLINNATVYGNVNGLVASDGGVLEIASGEFVLGDGEASNLWRVGYTSGDGEIVIRGGSFTKNAQSNNGFFGGKFYILGGTFEEKVQESIYIDSGDVYVGGGTFQTTISAKDDSNLSIAGGSFETAPTDYMVPGVSFDAATESVVKIEGSKVTIVDAQGLFVGGYETLEAAAADAGNGDVVTIHDDLTLSDTINVSGDVTITSDKGVVVTPAQGKSSIVLSDGAELLGVAFTLGSVASETNVVTMGSNSGVIDCSFTGPYDGADDAVNTRAIVGNSGSTGLSITGNTFTNLRQPGYINGGCTGTISGNTVTGTRGWVICGDSDMTIGDNEFSVNAVDIAIISNQNDTNNYSNEVIDLSKANSGAYVQNQLSSVEAEDGFIVVGREGSDSEKYTLQAALDGATEGDTVKLLGNVDCGAVNVPAGVTLDGNGKTITLDVELANGAFITVAGDDVTVKNAVIDTDGKAKHGVQFYRVDGGVLSGVTVNGGGYTAVQVNGSEATISNCTLNPDEGAYANIEMSMGSGVTEKPSIDLAGQSEPSNGKPFVYVDEATMARAIGAELEEGKHLTEEQRAQAVSELNKNLEGAKLTLSADGTATGSKPYVPPVASGSQVSVEAANGGSIKVSASRADEGDEVTITLTPDEGQEVRSVKVVDADGSAVEVKAGEKDGEFVFTMPDGAVTVTAAFGCDGGELCPTHGFEDVDQSDWYHDAVDWAVTNGVLNGYGDGGELLGPLATITRAEMAQVLWNRAGRPEAEADLSAFTDVDADAWYAGPVAWCLSEGIFNGYGDTFGTERPISREEVATVLWRLSGSPETSADLSSFSDSASVSDYATDALAWAVGSGVVTGKDDGAKLDPQGVCTRAEAAAMLMRLSAE